MQIILQLLMVPSDCAVQILPNNMDQVEGAFDIRNRVKGRVESFTYSAYNTQVSFNKVSGMIEGGNTSEVSGVTVTLL